MCPVRIGSGLGVPGLLRACFNMGKPEASLTIRLSFSIKWAGYILEIMNTANNIMKCFFARVHTQKNQRYARSNMSVPWQISLPPEAYQVTLSIFSCDVPCLTDTSMELVLHSWTSAHSVGWAALVGCESLDMVVRMRP